MPAWATPTRWSRCPSSQWFVAVAAIAAANGSRRPPLKLAFLRTAANAS